MRDMQASNTEEEPKIQKDQVVLLNERYNTPGTSLLTFHFEPYEYISSLIRLKEASVQHIGVEKKDVYVFDNLFSESESKELRNFSKNATFSRTSYASHESRGKGEVPALSMNNKEKWEFFTKPPQAVKEVYKLLSLFAYKIDGDISTLPWDLCDQNICCYC